MVFVCIERFDPPGAAPLACRPPEKTPVAGHVRQPCLKRAGARRAAALPPKRRGLPTVSLSGALLGEAAAATAIVRHAWQRGRIEDCFRMGKAGCQAERLAFRLANSQPRLMAINCGTAWRLLARTPLGQPKLGCAAEPLFKDPELGLLATTPGGSGCSGPTGWSRRYGWSPIWELPKPQARFRTGPLSHLIQHTTP